MKKAKFISAVLLMVVMAGCGVGNKKMADEIVTVDVSASYPKKEMLLQDLMDVEYVPLETSDDFITKGIVKAIGKNVILVNRGADGDILVFDRSGKGLKKINRFGQSGEEYSQVSNIVLDEDNNEMFIADYPARKILVYDLNGTFHRSFPFADTSYYQFLSNYDKDNLICFKGYSPTVENEQSCHILISKQDGSITKEIRIPFKEIETPVVAQDDYVVSPGFCLITSNQGNWMLTRASSDTIFHYLPDGTVNPLIVRTPTIHSMTPEVFLFPTVITDRYCFMHTMEKKLDFKTFKGFNGVDLVYDKQEKLISEYILYNDDSSNKMRVSLEQRPENPVNTEVVTFQVLEAANLVEANEKGELKGKLKEIAAGLNEESNPVIMLIKNKK